MNYRYVIHELGKLLVMFSAVMGALALMAWVIDAMERWRVDVGAEEALLVSCVACLVVGGLMWRITHRSRRFMGRREALLLVALSWVLGAVFAALPFFIWARLFAGDAEHPFRSFDNCYFEAMSGLTTTGATVLADIESVPHELLLWRAFTHWIGGLGIVVLFVAVLPSLGLGGKRLFKVEAPGPAPEGLQPQIRQTVRILWLIYCGLPVVEILALWVVAQMHIFDAVCHTFSTVATGGFSTKNASIGYYYNKPAVDVIVIVFMVLAGANFGLYYQLWRRRGAAVWKDTELRLYLAMLLFGSLLVAAAIANGGSSVVLTTGAEVAPDSAESIRQGIFTTVSVQSTTGFCTSDFNRWPFIAKAVLVAFMFVGGCSGSTAGGIKVIRVWIMLKVIFAQIERVVRPAVVRSLRVSGDRVDEQLQLSAMLYVLGVIVAFAIGWGTIMVFEQWNPESACTSTTAATASVATLCTIGPGLDAVGAVENYGWFSGPSKIMMCVLMALGRLEFFAIVVLFAPSFWRTE
jgi:trk system potassium uptake protein TrkH